MKQTNDFWLQSDERNDFWLQSNDTNDFWLQSNERNDFWLQCNKTRVCISYNKTWHQSYILIPWNSFSHWLRYFKVFQLSQMFTCGLSDLLLLAVGSLIVFILRAYILKVHILVSSEHKLCQTWNTCLVSCIYWSIASLNNLLILFLTTFTIKSYIY